MLPRENPLVASINRVAEETKLPRFIIPAPEALSLDALHTNKAMRRFRSEARKSSPEVNRFAKKSEREIERLARRETRLNRELKDALPIERDTVTTSLKLVRDLLFSKRSALQEKRSSHSGLQESVERLDRAYKHRERVLENILKRYPDAQIVDLSCLTLFKGKEGLPALAAFSIESPQSTIKVAADSVSLTDGIALSKSALGNLAASIQVAAGALVSRRVWDGYYEQWNTTGRGCFSRDQLIRSAIAEAKSKKIWKGDTGNGKLPAEASSITLTADFGEGGRVIPKSSRRIIRQAVDSKLFDRVVLLAETKSWKINYHDPSGDSPFLKGSVTTTPRTRDPLVVGLKKVGNQTLAILVHAFDTTRLEEYVRREFAVKPDQTTK